MSAHQRIELPPEFDTLHVGIALYDPESGLMLDANERLEAVMGYPRARLREMPVERYTANTYPFAESDFVDRLRLGAAGKTQEFNWRIKRGDGELIWARIHLAPRSVAGRDAVVAEVRDVTDYYETTHRAELFWRLLRHNLRNEVTVIQANAEQIERNAERRQTREAAEVVRERAAELGDIARSVKQIETAVEGNGGERVRRNASEAVRAVAADVQEGYPSAEITVEETEEMWIAVDSAFTHAITHAVENAIVHSEAAEPTVAVEIGPSPNTGRVDVTISDRNPPIRQSEIDSLFDREGTTSTNHGSGVGLFVMKWCIESLGGEIGFETRRPRGNVVHCYLPPADPPADAR